MKKILSAALLTCATAPTFLLFTQPAKADTATYCYPVVQREVIQNAADHQSAYVNGYSEGRQSAWRGEAYVPRTAGGEFARGFADGYYGRPFTGQAYAVPDQVREYASQQCNTYTQDRDYSDRDDDYYYGPPRRNWRRPLRPLPPLPPLPVRPPRPPQVRW